MDFSKFNTDELYNQFINAQPYSHLVIDNFIDPDYLTSLLQEIKGYKQIMDEDYQKNGDEHELQTKKIGLSDTERMGPIARHFFEQSQSPEMIAFLEKITGIPDVLPDPMLYGGGIHRTTTGGKLGIHADFNIHPYTGKNRRINILLYLNEDWKPEYNGELELWQSDMSKCVKSISPIFNRAVILRITDNALHGHPIPWQGHDNTPRLSIALYYYTDDRPEEEKSEPHMAIWKMC